MPIVENFRCRCDAGVAPRGLELKSHAAPIEREALEVLQTLARGDAWLACEALSTGRRWGVFVMAGHGARMARQVSDGLADSLRQRRLIAPEDGGEALRWRISATGRRWLRVQAPGIAAQPGGAATAMDTDMATTGKLPDMVDAQGAAKATRRGKTSGKADAKGRGKGRSKGRGAHGNRREGSDKDMQRLLVRDAESGSLREVLVNLKENPLMWLARRKDASGRPYLEAHHVAAGERLRQDYETACMQPQITASWNPALVAADRGRLKSGPRDPFPFAERVMAARQRVHGALESIGAELADVAVAVCCLDHGIEAAERALKWPRRSARLVLRIALERLADHYGLRPARAQHARRWQKALHWHAEDGHPTQLVPADDAATSRPADRHKG